MYNEAMTPNTKGNTRRYYHNTASPRQSNATASPRNYNTTISVWIILLATVSVLQAFLYFFGYLHSFHVDLNSIQKNKNHGSFLRLKSKEQPFNRTNPYYDTWCPYAQCFNSPLCSPCNRRFLFIIATGRSGSTTLLRMFNELPNVRLSGENMNELYLASQMMSNLESNNNFSNDLWVGKGRYYKPKIEGPFQHNALPLGSLSCVTQTLASMLNPPELPEDTFEMEDDSKTILGMKVIRIQDGDWSPAQAAKFFKQNFPCARYIINIRSDVNEQVRSFQTNFHWNVTETQIHEQNEFLKSLHVELGYSSYMIDVKWWQKKVDNLNDVVKWLGFESCAFNAVYHENKGGYDQDNNTISVGNKCRYPFI